jgi:hypothetical protein
MGFWSQVGILALHILVAGSVKRYFKNNGKNILRMVLNTRYMEAFGGYDTSLVANVNAVAV